MYSIFNELMLFLWRFIALLSLVNFTCSKKYKDNLQLSPIELIDLVRKEQYKNSVPYDQRKRKITGVTYNQDENPILQEDEEPESCDDDKLLKKRKVWSRWSKWGQCSVTCGRGTTVRHRVCVAGRCAHGEREEQRRQCAKGPCLAPTYNMTDELREFE